MIWKTYDIAHLMTFYDWEEIFPHGYGYNWEEKPMCQEPGCDHSGFRCYMSHDEDTHEYLCGNHAFENGYCTGCGTFIAGFTDDILCEHCSAELSDDDGDYDDYDYDDY